MLYKYTTMAMAAVHTNVDGGCAVIFAECMQRSGVGCGRTEGQCLLSSVYLNLKL